MAYKVHLACLGGNFNLIRFLVQPGFKNNINEFGSAGRGLDILIHYRYDHTDDELYMPCVLLLIEAGAEWSTNIIFEELISAIENRMVEIIFMKKTIFEKWILSRTKVYKICQNF